MDVLGIEPNTRSYRVRVYRGDGPVVGLIPETLVGAMPRHHDVYDWIARNADRIESALNTIAAGQTPRPPYDQLRLAKES